MKQNVRINTGSWTIIDAGHRKCSLATRDIHSITLQTENDMKRKHRVITQQDVQEAMKKFIGEGGTIVRQPDQVAFPGNVVGSSHAIYESILQPLSAPVPMRWSQYR